MSRRRSAFAAFSAATPCFEISFSPAKISGQSLLRFQPDRQRRELFSDPLSLSAPFVLPPVFAFGIRRSQICDHPALGFEIQR